MVEVIHLDKREVSYASEVLARVEDFLRALDVAGYRLPEKLDGSFGYPRNLMDEVKLAHRYLKEVKQ